MRNRRTQVVSPEPEHQPDAVVEPETEPTAGLVKSLLLPGSRVGSGLGAQLAGPAARTTLLNLGSMLFAFVTSIVLSRLLGARGYGIYVYAFAFPSVLAVIAPLGTGQLLVRNIATFSVERDWGGIRGLIRYSQRLVLLTSTVLVAGTAVIAWIFVGNRQPELRRTLFISLLLVPAMALISQREAVLRGFRRVVLGRLSETLIEPIALLSLIGVLYVAGGRHLSPAQAMIATVIAASVAMIAGALLVLRVTPARVRGAVARVDAGRWTRSAAWLVAIGGLQVVNLQMSVLLLGAIDSVDATAVLSVALRWSGMVSFLQTAAVFPLAPVFARLYASGSREEFQRLASKASWAVLVASTPVAILLVVAGRHALGIFGSQFEIGTTALTILVLGELVNVASGFVGPILISAGHERTLFVAAVWLTVARIALSALLTQLFGLNGAAVGQALGVALQNVALVIVVWRSMGVYSPGLGGHRIRARLARLRP